MATATRNLPEELLEEILGKLPKKDLKKARLACTLWSIAGAKWMFERVYFAPRKASMKTFTDIAENPIFARNTKELIYDARLFLPGLRDFDSYSAAFYARVLEESNELEDYTRTSTRSDQIQFAHQVYGDSIWNLKGLGAGEEMQRLRAGDDEEFYTNVADSHVRYVRLLDQQESIFRKGRDFRALCEGLKSFRNINKVSASAEDADWSDDFLHACDRDYEDIYVYTEEYIDEYMKFGPTVEPSAWWRRPNSQDDGEQDQEEDIKWDVRGVQTLLRAISTHCPSLKELKIGSMVYKGPMTTIFQLSDTDTEKVRIMVRRLTTLQLHPHITKSDDGPEYAKQHHCLELLLQEAKELRKLSLSTLSLDDDSEESGEGNEDIVLNERTDFGMLLGKVWPHLTHLFLSSASLKAGDLMSIIRAHRGSLRDLSLDGIFLLGKEGWEHFGQEMGQILRLHSIQVGILRDHVSKPYHLVRREQGLSFVRNMMQWALPDLPEIKEGACTITGRLKAGSS